MSIAVGENAGFRGVELGYAERVTDATTTNTGAYDDVTGMSITVNVGIRPIMVRAFARDIRHSAVNGNVYFRIAEGATAIVASVYCSSTVNASQSAYVERRLTPSPGLHTYKLTTALIGAGTGTIIADATDGPMFIQVVEV